MARKCLDARFIPRLPTSQQGEFLLELLSRHLGAAAKQKCL